MSKTNRFASIVLPIACLLLLATGCKASAAKGVEGLWQGTLKVPGGELRVVFHVNKAADGKLTATMDSPDQGATGIAVDECAFSKGKLTLAAKAIGGGFEGTMKNDSTIEGNWSQAGMSLPLVLKRIEKLEQALRPQEPKKPYPYKEEEVTVENKAAGITLAGTLTEPETGGPFPAVVLITGSGPENRNVHRVIGYFQQRLQVYGRGGEPCRRCGARVRGVIGEGRATYYCATCQV